ncbi:MAG: hypothetical protein IJ078_07375 [Succinivibrionaceae bacterium]|nr:hypothetical protein [Succinivibrionaceae bacterium]
MTEVEKLFKALIDAKIKYLKKNGIKPLTEEECKILDEYERRFGGLPADGGFSVEAAKECLETGRDFYDRFPKDVNP